MKYIFLLLIFCSTSFSQNGRVFDTYKTKSGSTNESDGTIFTKPFQEYNYIKTHRGIEVYETYKTKSYNTNGSKGTIFSKPFPKYIIINDKMYETYGTSTDLTNKSSGTIFTKPFQSEQILNKNTSNTRHQIIKITYETKSNELLPRYNGEGEITYGE